MTTVRLRRWQKEALDLLVSSPGADFLVVATPGAGKTTFALAAAVADLGLHPTRKVVVVVPTSHLKLQWATAASRFGLHLEPVWSSTAGRLPADMHGMVVTYQQVAANPASLRSHAHRCVVVLDEVHHTGEDRRWGEAVHHAFAPSPARLGLSGTPFRSDTRAIPFVRYVNDEARADFEYGYAAALADRNVVRPVWFPAIGGHMEWAGPDGTLNAAGFDDTLDQVRSAQRLRTALDLGGEWLPAVLAQADEKLLSLQADDPRAAGMVIAADQEHAKGIVKVLRELRRMRVVLATSDDPAASRRIAEFAEGSAPWLVAVRMVSEGVDIPRLRLGVYATTTTTELFFRQAVGRFVRHTGGSASSERAWLFIPDDPRLRRWASTVAEARRHILRARADVGIEPPEAPEQALDGAPDGEAGRQLSLFEALSASGAEAVATIEAGTARPEAGRDDQVAALDAADAVDTSVTVTLPLPPPPSGASRPFRAHQEAAGVPLAQLKRQLRSRNAELARQLARRGRVSHQDVNASLNRAVGIVSVAGATLDQLAARAEQAERWLG